MRVLTGLIVLALIGTTRAEAWPQWRGPQRDGHVASGPVWPDDLNTVKQMWQVPMGPSYSGPVVAGGRVFVTETVDAEREVVRALDRTTGRELWRQSWAGAMAVPFFAKRNGDWIRATPACDGVALYVAGMRDVLVSLDVATGAERWRVDFTQRDGTPLPSFGHVSSPLVRDGAVFVQAGGACQRLDAKTGATMWRSLVDQGGMHGSAFSSPVWATLQGVPQLLVQTRTTLHGLDPQSGAPLWSQPVPAFRGMNILTPTVWRDGVLTSTHRNATFFYNVKKTAAGFGVEEGWRDKAKGYMSSPVIINDHAYLHLGNGRLACFDLVAGQPRWRSEPFGQYWSVAVRGERMLALDERGELLLMRANPERFELLARRTVSEEPAWGHIAVTDRQIFVRDLKAVTAFEWGAHE